MNNLKRRKFNNLYWTYLVIAICTFLMTDIDYTRILAFLVGITTLTFYTFDERGKYAFEDGEEDDYEDK